MESNAFILSFQMVLTLSIFGVMGVLALPGFVGAFYCGRGQDFYYPFFGRKLEEYLMRGSEDGNVVNEIKEDQLIAAACHTSALIQMWGILTPLLVWFSLKERSAYLRFQAAQALWYQIIAFVLYIIAGALYFIGVFAMVFVAILLSSGGLGREYGMVIFLILLVLMLLFASVVILVFPMYHLFAFIASLRVMRGEAYRYPLLGNFLARRMNIT